MTVGVDDLVVVEHCIARLDLAEKPLPDPIVARQFGAAKTVVRKAIGLIENHRKGALTAFVGFRASREEQVEGPIGDCN